MRMRHLPALAAIALLGLAAVAAADTVYLKDGRVLKGKAIDQPGDEVLVRQPRGDVVLKRSEIARIEVDATADASGAAAEQDLVVFNDGKQVEGKVVVSEDGRQVTIHGRFGTISVERKEVKQIVFAGEKRPGEAARGGVAEVVKGLVDRLFAGKDEAERTSARADLRTLGVFAVPHLKDAVAAAPPERKALLAEVLAEARLAAAVPAPVLDKVKDAQARLASPDAAMRRACVKEIVLEAPGAAPEVLSHLARFDADPDVRALAVAQLSALNCHAELIEIVRSDDPALKLAASIGLGDAGILVGVPVLIDALKLDDAKIRAHAIEKLKAWTGEFHGFFPEDPKEKRSEAIGRWETWWAANGERLVDASVKATVRPDTITDEDRAEARRLFGLANAAWDALPQKPGERAIEVGKALYYLRQALERDPTLVPARLARAILLITEAEERAEARRDLELLATRYAKEAGPRGLAVARYYLGRLNELEGRLDEARASYAASVGADPRFAEGQMALADLIYRRAIEGALSRADVEEALRDSLAALRRAQEVLEGEDEGLEDSARKFIPAAGSNPEGVTFRRTLRDLRTDITAARARVHFLAGRSLAALQMLPEAALHYQAAARLAPERADYREAAAYWKAQALGREAPPAAPGSATGIEVPKLPPLPPPGDATR